MKTPVSEVVAPVAGLVLAAGLSTRMGRNKQLLELRGETVVARAARMAHEAGLSPVMVVLGHQAELVRAAVAHLPILTVENPSPERGATSSVREGIAALAKHAPAAQAAVVILSDMPLVTAAMVRGLVESWRDRRPPLVFSLYDGVIAPPTLFDASLFAELRALDDEGCLKRVVKRHRAEALEARWPASVLADLDEPGDLPRIETLLGGAGDVR